MRSIIHAEGGNICKKVTSGLPIIHSDPTQAPAAGWMMPHAFRSESRGATLDGHFTYQIRLHHPADCYRSWPLKSADPLDTRLQRFRPPRDAAVSIKNLPSSRLLADAITWAAVA
jgi:hypothetical protein